jgi:hypothetical protein
LSRSTKRRQPLRIGWRRGFSWSGRPFSRRGRLGGRGRFSRRSFRGGRGCRIGRSNSGWRSRRRSGCGRCLAATDGREGQAGDGQQGEQLLHGSVFLKGKPPNDLRTAGRSCSQSRYSHRACSACSYSPQAEISPSCYFP